MPRLAVKLLTTKDMDQAFVIARRAEQNECQTPGRGTKIFSPDSDVFE
ncbi:MAG: hypothetical protein R2874_00915 [Desulfobacterales bacterium]